MRNATASKRPRITITRRALIARLNRRLDRENQGLRLDRRTGKFYIVNRASKSVMETGLDAGTLADRLGVLAAWEVAE